MRLYIDCSKFDEVLLNATGVYKNYLWRELPEGYFPVIWLARKTQFIVALAETQLNEVLACIHENARRIYVVHSSIIDELTGGTQLADCLERERAADTNPPDLSDVDVLVDIYNNIDERIRVMLEQNQEYLDIKNFDSSLTKATTIFGHGSGPVTELNRFRDTLKFFIRHAPAAQNWSDKAIDANWQSIVYAVFNKGLELKQAQSCGRDVDGRELETAFSALMKRLLG